MNRIIILVFTFINLLIGSSGYSQTECLLDSEYHKFCIGFKIKVYFNTKTEISINSQDSLTNLVLFDSTLYETQELVFIFKGEQSDFEKEKVNYPDNKVYPIPINKSGIYYINVIYRQKFMLVK